MDKTLAQMEILTKESGSKGKCMGKASSLINKKNI
jgi:hypothetical protein